MSDKFNAFFDKYNLSNILNKAKTISKKECEAVYEYFERKRPERMMEFGVQFGCSTRFFIDATDDLGIPMKIDSWDIESRLRFVDTGHPRFDFHVEDITDKARSVIEKYNPNVIFLDAHAYDLTKNIMQVCLDDKIDFIAHDVGLEFKELIDTRSKNLQDRSVYVPWECQVMAELIDPSLWEDKDYENDDLSITFVRDKYGVSIAEHKNATK